jgi:hypothetical protein
LAGMAYSQCILPVFLKKYMLISPKYLGKIGKIKGH